LHLLASYADLVTFVSYLKESGVHARPAEKSFKVARKEVNVENAQRINRLDMSWAHAHWVGSNRFHIALPLTEL